MDEISELGVTMSNIFITSDEHFGHARIIELAHRPFTSVEEMNETIIERFNKKVPNNPNFITFHVGDLFWHTMTPSEAMTILSRLHGKHGFLYGNHDELMENHKLLQAMFVFVRGENKAGGAKIIKFNKRSLTIDHFAHRVWQGSHKGHWHVYGHSHNALPGLGKSFDIGVDGHNFEPWSLEEIEARMETLPQHHVINNTGEGMTEDVVMETPTCGRGSTMAVQPICNRQVSGSSPLPGSIMNRRPLC